MECCNNTNENNEKLTIRSKEDKKNIEVRINKIIGQLNAIKKMVEENKYCEDILVQLSASKNAIKSLSLNILNNHLNICIKSHLDSQETVEELMRLFKTFTKDQ